MRASRQRLASCLPPAAAIAMAAAATVTTGCQRYPYDPEKATRPYPSQLAQGSLADIQVIPNINGGTLKLVNPTPVSYSNFDLWMNRRYMRHVDALAAGQTIELPIDTFWDERGEGPFPGGWLRYYEPTPVILVQIQSGPDTPLVGLVAKPPDTDKR